MSTRQGGTLTGPHGRARERDECLVSVAYVSKFLEVGGPTLRSVEGVPGPLLPVGPHVVAEARPVLHGPTCVGGRVGDSTLVLGVPLPRHAEVVVRGTLTTRGPVPQ